MIIRDNRAVSNADYLRGRADAADAVEGLEEGLDISVSNGGYDCCSCPSLDFLFIDAIHAARGEA